MNKEDHTTYDQATELDLAYQGDRDRYVKSSFWGKYDGYNQKQLASHIMLDSHSLEKSLSSENFELGHGFNKVEELADLLITYKERGFDISHMAYRTGLSIIKIHIEMYHGTEYEDTIERLVARIKEDSLDKSVTDIAGVKKIEYLSKKDNDKKNFADLAEGRFSVREFSGKKIDKKDIEEAIRIAQKSPSACNRQSTRIHRIHDKEIAKEIMTIQDGFSYDTPPEYILLVTTDDSSFSGPGERNQGFIDGGMFAMSLMYALEYKKIAACPLHASFTFDKEKLFRQILDIPDSEKLIVFLALGSFKDSFVVAKSYRYPTSYIINDITQLKSREEQVAQESTKIPEPIIRLSAVIHEKIRTLKRKVRIRTRLRSVQRARQEGKTFFNIYSRLVFLTRSKKSKVYIFGAPFHSNLGDQAQTYCMEKWYKDKFPDRSVLSIDTASAQKQEFYIINKIRQTIKSGDRIVLHSGYHTTDIWEMENNLNLRIIETFPDFPIVVFPQTIHFEDNNNLRKTVDIYRKHGNITLMCRDEESHKIAKENFDNVHILLMPDIVTSLIGDSDFIVPPHEKERDGIAMCFRNDKESKYGSEVQFMKKSVEDLTNRVDVMDTTVDTDWEFIAANRPKILRNFMKDLSKYKLVITDRYHGTIFSAITGTPVIVIGSTDHKLSSGVKWFTDKFFKDAIFYAGSPSEAIKMAHKIYGRYDYGKEIPPIFNEKYWNTLRLDN